MRHIRKDELYEVAAFIHSETVCVVSVCMCLFGLKSQTKVLIL